jgi:dTMP kinase
MFIVLEGIDGAGKGRQRNEIITLLQDSVQELGTTDFPDHKGVLYNHIIHPALHEEIDLSASSWFLTFALDQVIWQPKIIDSIRSKTHFFIADGYFTTNLVYQCIINKNVKLEDALHFANVFGIKQPDITIFIDVDPEIAMERKLNEEGHDEGLDINERSLNKQINIRKGYHELINNKVFGKWAIVDGNGTIEDVKNKIISTLVDQNIIII